MTDNSYYKNLVEALLFSAVEPLTLETLQDWLPEKVELVPILKQLQQDYAARGIRLVQRGDRWRFQTAPDVSLSKDVTLPKKLSRAAIETLSIIAYHAPVTRAEIEHIRGVATSRGTLDILIETGWIRPGGRRDVPGRPLTWKTTPEFLDHFNLETLKDLPNLQELKDTGLLDTRPALDIVKESDLHEDDR